MLAGPLRLRASHVGGRGRRSSGSSSMSLACRPRTPAAKPPPVASRVRVPGRGASSSGSNESSAICQQLLLTYFGPARESVILNRRKRARFHVGGSAHLPKSIRPRAALRARCAPRNATQPTPRAQRCWSAGPSSALSGRWGSPMGHAAGCRFRCRKPPTPQNLPRRGSREPDCNMLLPSRSAHLVIIGEGPHGGDVAHPTPRLAGERACVRARARARALIWASPTARSPTAPSAPVAEARRRSEVDGGAAASRAGPRARLPAPRSGARGRSPCESAKRGSPTPQQAVAAMCERSACARARRRAIWRPHTRA